MKNNIIILALCLLLSNILQAQVFLKNAKADTLQFVIQQVRLDSSQKDYIYTPLSASLQYDFEAQYPFYKITSEETSLQVGDFLQIDLLQLPDSGFLYFFSIDDMQNINLHFKGDSCTHSNLPLTIPSRSEGLGIDYEGTERFVFWYSPHEIQEYEKLAGGLEFTIGRFMQRIVNQLGKNLVLPSKTWHLFKEKQELGLRLLQPISDKNAVIPIVVEFEVVAKKQETPTFSQPKNPSNTDKK